MKEKAERLDLKYGGRSEIQPLIKPRGPYILDEEGADELLKKLIDDLDHFFINNEIDEKIEAPIESDQKCRKSISSFNKLNRDGDKVYVASANPNSPDYVDPRNSFNSSYMIELVQ